MIKYAYLLRKLIVFCVCACTQKHYIIFGIIFEKKLLRAKNRQTFLRSLSYTCKIPPYTFFLTCTCHFAHKKSLFLNNLKNKLVIMNDHSKPSRIIFAQSTHNPRNTAGGKRNFPCHALYAVSATMFYVIKNGGHR